MNPKNEVTLGATRSFLFRDLVAMVIMAAGCAATTDQQARASTGEHRRTSSIAGQAAVTAWATPGVYHPLERGTTLSMLSKEYGVPVERLMEVNRIVDPTSIPAGDLIFVPGATRMLPVKPLPSPASRFAWPLGGCITSPFGDTGTRAHHAGIDIDGKRGDPIRAAADGRVVRIDDDPHYGLLVVLEHADGYATLYAHASCLLVGEGEYASRGRVIALVGESGNARGTHLHFEIRRNGRAVDPFPFMAKRRAAVQVGGVAGRLSPRSAS
jgi:murein DD-endopeptidase MepM/ murein hydrolase activator NlpD